MVTRFGKDEMEHRIKSENETRFGEDEMEHRIKSENGDEIWEG